MACDAISNCWEFDTKLHLQDSLLQARFSATQIFDYFTKWCRDNCFQHRNITPSSFGIKMNKFDSIKKKRSSRNNIYVIDFRKLAKDLHVYYIDNSLQN